MTPFTEADVDEKKDVTEMMCFMKHRLLLLCEDISKILDKVFTIRSCDGLVVTRQAVLDTLGEDPGWQKLRINQKLLAGVCPEIIRTKMVRSTHLFFLSFCES